MPDFQTPLRRKNLDVQCLRCGVFNIHDNKICGKCGASLPVIYDEKGQPFNWEDAQGYESLVGKPEPKGVRHRSVGRTRWVLRAIILIIAVLGAIYIINARH